MKVARVRTILTTALVALAIAVGTAPLAAQNPGTSPAELVRQAVKNEIAANTGNAKFMFTDRKTTLHGAQIRLIAETEQATAGMLVAINDKPLTPEQRQSELTRLERLVNDPEELRRKQRSEKEDAERTMRIVRAMPDAFLFEADGSETGTESVGRPGDQLVRLRFHPNPRYSPPSHVEQVLTGMQGDILIDANKHRIAKIDGTLFKEVSFGWGILGHLDRGGHFLVQQAGVGEDQWEVTRMDLGFTGKELFFRSINIKSDEVCSGFRPVPSNLTFAQAVELLKKQKAELVESRENGGVLVK